MSKLVNVTTLPSQGQAPGPSADENAFPRDSEFHEKESEMDRLIQSMVEKAMKFPNLVNDRAAIGMMTTAFAGEGRRRLQERMRGIFDAAGPILADDGLKAKEISHDE